MTAVWMRARSELRGRWRALVSATILTGLFGAAVLATLAGARRTQTAYPRFLERAKAYDVIVSDLTVFAEVFWKPDFDALARLPYVETAIQLESGYIHAGADAPQGMGFLTSKDPRFGTAINVPYVVRGRLPVAADEIAVPYFADRTNEMKQVDLGSFRVGDTMTFDAHDHKERFKVVGETAIPGELPPRPQLGWQILVSPAFVDRYATGCEVGGPSCLLDFRIASMMIRFQHRADILRFNRDTAAMTNGKVLANQVLSSHTRAVQGSSDLQAEALRLLALFVGLTGLLIVGQLLARESALGAPEDETLRALGFSRSQQFVFGIVRAMPIAVGGAVLSVLLAVAASPAFPRGSVRAVESTAFSFDGLTLGLGAAGVLVAVAALMLIPAWRASVNAGRAQEAANRPSTIASAVTSMGLSASAVAGTRLALDPGRGRTAVPVVSSLVIVAMGIGSFIAATTFAVSLSQIINNPALYGKSWDDVVNTQSDALNEDPEEQQRYSAAAGAALASDPDVLALAAVDSGAPIIVEAPTGPPGGVSVLGMAIKNLKGSLYPPIVEGVPPTGSHDVVLGARMLKALGITLNASHPPTVDIGLQAAGEKRIHVRVVGRGIIPPLGNFGELGFGVLLSGDTALGEVLGDSTDVPPVTDLIVRWRPGVKPADVVARYKKDFPDMRIGEGLTGGRFADAVNFGGVQGAPLIVGGVLAALGAAALAHVLVTSIRRRRRDLAILKTLGFVRGQARRAVAWQATVMVGFATCIGVPLGVVAGRWLWTKVAGNIGVLARPATSVLVLAFIAPAVVVLANIIALLPARAAARTQPALVLRSE